MQLFLFSVAALSAVGSAARTSRARGRRAQESGSNIIGNSFGDAAHKSSSSDSDDFTDDFGDNSMGYCKLNKLDEIETLNDLTFVSEELVLEFIDVYIYDDGTVYAEAISELRDFVKLARKYMTKDQSNMFDDEDILQSIMEMNVRGTPRRLTNACIEQIKGAVSDSVKQFNVLMNVGTSFVLPDDASLMGDAAMSSELSTTYSLLLEILEDSQMSTTMDSFDTFMLLVLNNYAIFNANKYFNEQYIEAITSWQEMALSPVSIMAKYSAVFLTMGDQLEAEFIEKNMRQALDVIYQSTVAVCNAPTSMPSSAPSLSPASANQELTVVVVADFVFSDVTQAEMDASWLQFKSAFPARKFCLLQPRGREPSQLKIPADFLAAESNTVFAKIDVDAGSDFSRSNWYDLCGLYGTKGRGIGKIPILDVAFDNTSSSATLFETTAAAEGQVAIEVNLLADSNWINPMIRNF